MESQENFSYLSKGLETLVGQSKGQVQFDQQYVEISQHIARDISTHKITFLNVIDGLKSLLLCSSPEERSKGVLILSETLCYLEDDCLTPQEMTVVAAYFGQKLRDHHQVAAASFKGISALICSKNIPSESTILLLSSLFNDVPCQQQVQADRLTIYKILETAVSRQSRAINLMGIDFVYGVITIIDGERDPKNLIYLFNWLPNFLTATKLGHLSEEMFEVLSCYFPIDFKPSKDDKHNISRQSLAEALCSCLTCLPDFGEYGITLALEKLDSTLKTAVEDSLDLLKSGCRSYEVEPYNAHSIELWSGLQKKYFGVLDLDLKGKCLDTLQLIINKLSQGDPKAFEGTILDITDTLKRNMLPDSKLYQESSNILVHVAKGSRVSSVLVAQKVCPLLENVFKISNSPKEKAAAMRSFVEFVKAVVENDPTSFSKVEEIANCPVLCSQAVTSNNVDLIAEGYRAFNALLEFLPQDIKDMFMYNLHEALLENTLDVKIKTEVQRAFKRASMLFPEEVALKVLHKNGLSTCDAIDSYLDSLGGIVKLPYFQEHFADIFIYYATKDIASSAVALRNLNKLWCDSLSRIMYKKDFIAKLIEFLQQVDDKQNIQDAFLCDVKVCIENITRVQERNTQKDIYITHSIKEFYNPAIFVVVLCALIVPLREGVFDDYSKIDFLINSRVLSMKIIRDTLAETIGNILNKLSEDILEEKLSKFNNTYGVSPYDSKIWHTAWIARGLVTRNYPKAWYYVDQLIMTLNDSDEAAEAFKIIMNDSDKVISKENYCTIVPLYRQKTFVYCTNKLNEIQDNNEGHLRSMGFLIERAPKAAIVGSFKKIYRLIFQSLEKCKDSTTLLIMLRRLTEFLVSGESIIIDNLEDILVRILHLTTFELSMDVRIAAINFLKQVASTCRLYLLLPHKQMVIQKLGECIDDRKRLVRQEAMECRCTWYLLDAPI